MRSPDGLFWWDGTAWQRVSEDSLPPDVEAEEVSVRSPAEIPPPPGSGQAAAEPAAGPRRGQGYGSEHFEPERWLGHRLPSPRSGFPGLVYRLSGRRINLGPTQRQLQEASHLAQTRTLISDPPARVAIASAKGGVGKTTISLGLATVLGRNRGTERIIAVESNPHHGTYRSRLQVGHQRSIEDLLNLIEQSAGPSEISLPLLHLYTSTVPDNRFEILTAPLDVAVARLLGEPEYERVLGLLYRFYDICLFDLGTGLLDSVTAHLLLNVADQVVVVSPAALDGGQLADATLSYLEARRGADWLRERCLVAINAVRKETLAEVEAMEKHFRWRVRAVHRIRWEREMESGGLWSWEETSPGFREDYTALAASVALGFALGAAPDSVSTWAR